MVNDGNQRGRTILIGINLGQMLFFAEAFCSLVGLVFTCVVDYLWYVDVCSTYSLWLDDTE